MDLLTEERIIEEKTSSCQMIQEILGILILLE